MDTNAQRPGRPLQNARGSDAPGDFRAAVPRRRKDGRGADTYGRGLATGRLEASRGPEAGRLGARSPRRASDALHGAAWRLGPPDRLDQPDGWLLGEPVRRPRRPSQEDGPMSNASTATRSVVVERELPHPPEKLWR